MRLALFICAATTALTIASGSANAASNSRPSRAAIHPSPALVRQFALTALQNLKGPAQRPFLALLKSLPPANPGVVISTKATKNMSCSGGVCTPTARVAVLNVGQLTSMLMDGSVTVGTSALAPDIVVNAPFSWTSANGLTLQAIGNILVNRAVSDAGPAPLTLTYNANGSGGMLSFGPKAHISFFSTGNALTINGQGYILANNIQTLAQLIARNPSGNFALSANYNAKLDGRYTHSPIQTVFQGNFEGLGNLISGLRVESANGDQPIGFFGQINNNGHVENLTLTSAQIKVNGILYSGLGGFAGYNKGTLLNSSFSGTVSVANCSNGAVGGLAGFNDGVISFGHSGGSASATSSIFEPCWVGGLVGLSAFTQTADIGYSYSTASASFTGPNGTIGDVGGLAGASAINDIIVSTIAHTFATGSAQATGGTCSCIVGGLIGENPELGSISDSSASGAVNGADGLWLGGLVGDNVFGSVVDSVATGGVSGGQNCSCGGAFGLTQVGPVSETTSYGPISAGAGSQIGGFVGWDTNPGDLSDDGWCTTSSGFTDIHHGAGDPADDPGITPFTC
jgi:hypothetical protein